MSALLSLLSESQFCFFSHSLCMHVCVKSLVQMVIFVGTVVLWDFSNKFTVMYTKSGPQDLKLLKCN